MICKDRKINAIAGLIYILPAKLTDFGTSQL
jgi:hypothetical protein